MDHRREIDGLRALAVIPVILFHAGFEAFSGGFVGVDIFFVISGYLITTIILAELERGSFSIVNFYERRARRIMPALFLVMVVCIPFAWFWLLPSDLRDFSRSLAVVSLFASNILFWSESGYFDSATELKPLLHTWSLAVEEQYYVLFPLFLMLCWRLGKRWILIALVFVFVVSLAGAQWGAYAKPAAAFYLLPTRIWELLIGAFAAFYLSQANRKDVGRGVSELAGWLGVSLIFYAIFAYSKITPFPGFYALVPTLGALLIIVFASQQTTVGRIMGNKAFVGIGLISYSAYLWHQPIFAFTRHKSVSEPSALLFLGLSLLTIGLAYLSWRFVEAPFRRKGAFSRRYIFGLVLLGTGFFLLVGLVGYKQNGFEDYYFKNRVGSADKEIISYTKYGESAEFKRGYRYGTCFYGSELNSFEYFDRSECLAISTKKKNYLVLGDSHSAHLADAFRNNFPQHNFLQASASGCKPVLPLAGEKRCTDLVNFIYGSFLPSNKIDGIILSARWATNDIESLKGTVDHLSKYVSIVYVMGPTVEYRPSLPLLILKLKSKVGDSEAIRRYTDQERFALSDQMGLALKSKNALYVPIVQEFCSSVSCRILTKDGVPMVWDYGHFTLEGADFLVKSLLKKEMLKLP
ncbi:MAG: acyltransferase [Burkholderiales bacterium PBB6]|nr:MAG: acyltransferase [Burkholderiales bacterium PBB6]